MIHTALTDAPLLGCGIDIHDEACLCDVQLPDTPLTPKFGFDQIHHADVVMRATGLDPMVGGRHLASFLDQLGSAYEAVSRLSALDDVDDDAVGLHALRDAIGEQLQAGESIVDLTDILGESFARIVAGISGGVTSTCWTWSELEWIRWEVALEDGMTVVSHLAEAFNIEQSTAKRMMQLWGVQDDGSAKTENDRQAKEIIDANPEMPPKAMHEHLAAVGIEYRRDSIVRYRSKQRKANLRPQEG